MACRVMGLIRTPLKRQVSVLRPHCETARVLSTSTSARVILTLHKHVAAEEDAQIVMKHRGALTPRTSRSSETDHACLDPSHVSAVMSMLHANYV